jgi:hypothetical protein
VKIARFLITPEFLREVLHLPAGTDIVGASCHYPLHVELVVTHPDLPDVTLAQGESPPLVAPTFIRQDHEVMFVGWGRT